MITWGSNSVIFNLLTFDVNFPEWHHYIGCQCDVINIKTFMKFWGTSFKFWLHHCVPMIGFKNNKSLRDHLLRSQLLNIERRSTPKPYGGKSIPCHLCKNMKDIYAFKSKHFDEVHESNNDYFNSKVAVYLIECCFCDKHYNVSPKTEFCSRANNYKSMHQSL